MQAATNGLAGFLAQIPSGAAAAYGFPEGVQQARSGQPVQMEQLAAASLQQLAESGRLEDRVRPMDSWFFPVLSGSEIRALLLVERRGSRWEAVSLGYAPVAKAWGALLKSWPAERGYHPRFIAVFEAQRYYFNIPEVNDRNLTLLHGRDSAAAPQERDWTKLRNAAEEAGGLAAQINGAHGR